MSSFFYRKHILQNSTIKSFLHLSQNHGIGNNRFLEFLQLRLFVHSALVHAHAPCTPWSLLHQQGFLEGLKNQVMPVTGSNLLLNMQPHGRNHGTLTWKHTHLLLSELDQDFSLSMEQNPNLVLKYPHHGKKRSDEDQFPGTDFTADIFH